MAEIAVSRLTKRFGATAAVDAMDLTIGDGEFFVLLGPTGAGKTTTLNYMVNLINSERRCKVVTIEDPIEFVHRNNRAIIVQQEVSAANSFTSGRADLASRPI